MFVLEALVLLAAAANGVTIAVDGDWAAPANTALLVLLAVVTFFTRRSDRKHHSIVERSVQQVDRKVSDRVLPELREIKTGERDPRARTRESDSP